MTTQICDALLHIDETLENWQYDVLEDHLRIQEGVIATGHSRSSPHLMFIEYDPDSAKPANFLRMVERHGYHAERIG